MSRMISWYEISALKLIAGASCFPQPIPEEHPLPVYQLYSPLTGAGRAAKRVQIPALIRQSRFHSPGLLLIVSEFSDPVLFLSRISSRFVNSSGLLEE